MFFQTQAKAVCKDQRQKTSGSLGRGLCSAQTLLWYYLCLEGLS